MHISFDADHPTLYGNEQCDTIIEWRIMKRIGPTARDRVKYGKRTGVAAALTSVAVTGWIASSLGVGDLRFFLVGATTTVVV